MDTNISLKFVCFSRPVFITPNNDREALPNEAPTSTSFIVLNEFENFWSSFFSSSNRFHFGYPLRFYNKLILFHKISHLNHDFQQMTNLKFNIFLVEHWSFGILWEISEVFFLSFLWSFFTIILLYFEKVTTVHITWYLWKRSYNAFSMGM